MFKFLVLAVLLLSVAFAEVSQEDVENYSRCIAEIEVTCDETVDYNDYDECKSDYQEGDDISGAEYFGLLKDCYSAIADDLDGDCKKFYQGMADCNGSVLGFALVLLALVTLLI